MPRQTDVPAWKRSLCRKAAKSRSRWTNKAMAERLGLTEHQVRHYAAERK